MTRLKTYGISPKAVAALVWPLVVALGAAVASWIVTGNFSDSEIRTAASGVILSLIAAAGAYVKPPGDVRDATGNPPR
jgi:VIT1/CCC1 family predicted Fe2+/Mn2+ transporter